MPRHAIHCGDDLCRGECVGEPTDYANLAGSADVAPSAPASLGGGHGAQGDPATGRSVPCETPAPQTWVGDLDPIDPPDHWSGADTWAEYEGVR